MATTARAAPHRARGRAHGAPRARRARCACGVVRTGVPDGRTEVRGKRPLALLCVALRSRLCAPSPSLRAQTLRCRPSAHIEVSCCAADAQPYAWQTFRFELAGGKPVTEDITATIEGSSLVCETIARPLGITFEERGGRCVVDAVVEGSNAESADVQSGDILRMCTAILTTTPKVDELSYYSNPPSKVGASERSGCQRGWGRSFHSRDAGALTLIPLLGRKRIFTEGALTPSTFSLRFRCTCRASLIRPISPLSVSWARSSPTASSPMLRAARRRSRRSSWCWSGPQRSECVGGC